MKSTALPLRWDFSIVLAFTALAALGYGLLPRLNLRYLPRSERPSLTVSYQWPGATPRTLEAQVSAPLEAAFNLIQGIETLYAISGQGQGQVRIEAAEGSDLDALRFEVAGKLRQLYPQLPEGLNYPDIAVANAASSEAERPLLIYALSGPGEAHALAAYAEAQLLPRMGRSPGIGRVRLSGSQTPEWHLRYDPQHWQQLGIQGADLRAALADYYGRAALGQQALAEGEAQALQWHGGEGYDAAALARVPLCRRGGRQLYLGDVLRIEQGFAPSPGFFRIRGNSSIRLLCYAEEGGNALQASAALRRAVAGWALPPGYRLDLEEDSAERLRHELDNIYWRAGLSLALLLLFSGLAYRRWRYALLLAYALAVNLGIALLAFALLGIQIHLYALAGISISLGLAMDNLLLMAHHVERHGDRSVLPAILAATLTSACALLALYFLPPEWRASLAAFGEVVLLSLAISVAVAYWFVPALMQRLGLGQGGAPRASAPLRAARRALRWQWAHSRLLRGLRRHRALVGLAALLAFGLPVYELPAHWPGQDWYNRSLGSDWYRERIAPWLNRGLGGTLRLFDWYVFEGAGYRQPEGSRLHIEVSMEQGASPEQMDALLRRVEQAIEQSAGGIPLYYTSELRGRRFGELVLHLPDSLPPALPYRLRQRAIALGSELGGANWQVYGVGEAFSNASGAMPVRYRLALYGYNLDELDRQARIFADSLLRHPRIHTVDTEAAIQWWQRRARQFVLRWDMAALQREGLSPADFQAPLAAANLQPGSLFTLPDGRALRLLPDPPDTRWGLLARQVPGPDGRALRSGQLATLALEDNLPEIHKENQQYIRMIEWEYTGAAKFGNAYFQEVAAAMRRQMPLGYGFELKDDYGIRWGAAERRSGALLLLIAGLIFIVCAAFFESLRQALLVLAIVPLSFIGLFLGFYLSGRAFDQGGYTAFLLLSGLTVNSIIVLLQRFRQLQRRWPRRPEARLLARAYADKMPPILLTVLSTGLGLLPFLLDARLVFWPALALGTLSGLVFSMLALYLVLPAWILRRR